MKRAALALALVAAYALGTMQPHASAADSISAVVEQLKGIRQELQAIRRHMDGDR